METHQDTSTLKTLADAVTETAAAENAKEASESAGAEGLDINSAFEGGATMTEVPQTEIRVVGPGGPDSGSGESKGNGVSLSFAGVGEKQCGYPNVEESDRQNRSVDKGPAGINGTLSSEAQMGENRGSRGIEDLNDGRAFPMEMDGGKESDDVEDIEDHRYSVGDLVWGKIKSHPWWPGQIYDPYYASDSAMKYRQKGRLLVAYFGDGSFAWCMPSQLIPFAEHFEDMSKQSSSKTFVNAVQEAVDEIGRLVELEMTCPCIPEKYRSGLTRPLAVNAGIKAGVLVPDGEIGKLLSFRYEPIELLATVGNAAESVSFANMLELAILKSWLSAFYRDRGGHVLPVYYGPLQIEGLEDKIGNGTIDTNDFSVPIEVPIHRPLEEELFSSATTGSANGDAPQEDKNYHKRKQKSVAELMAEGVGAKHKASKRSSHGEGTNASNSAAKKQKFIDEVEDRSGIFEAASGRKSGRKKKADIFQSGEPTASNAPNASRTEERMQERSLSSKQAKDKITIPDGNDGEGVKGPEEISSPRERKKSKYLSPPYTTPHFRTGNLNSRKEDLEGEPEKDANSERIGERITKAAGKLLDSPSGVMCNCTTVEKRLLKGETDNGANLISENGNRGLKTFIETMDANSSVNQLLSGVQSFAVNPLYSWNDRLLDLIGGFILAFRRSMYVKDASCKDNSKSHLGRKKKSLDSVPEKLVNDPSQTGGTSHGAQTDSKESMLKRDGDTPKAKSSSKNSIQVKSNAPKLKKAARHSEKKEDDKEVEIKSSRVESMCQVSETAGAIPDKTVIASNSAVADITDLGSMREKLKIITSMLEKCDDKISSKAKSKLGGDVDLLFEKVKKIAETASK